jgi:hypothetical protein
LRKRHTPEQIATALQQAEAGASSTNKPLSTRCASTRPSLALGPGACIEAVRTGAKTPFEEAITDITAPGKKNRPMDAATFRTKLLGSWRLVSMEWRDERGNLRPDLVADQVGHLNYDASGTVSAQLMRRGQAHFSSDDFLRATTDEKAAAWSHYFGYFGTFTLGEGNDTIVHHVEGSSFPNLIGEQQVRHCTFEGSRLILSAQGPWGDVSIIWDKVNEA